MRSALRTLGEPMREDQRRPASISRSSACWDDCLVLGIDRGERLVEDQDGGVAEQRAGDGDAAGAGHRTTGLPRSPTHRLIACGRRAMNSVGVGAAGGRAQLVQRRPGLAERRLSSRCLEEVRVLLHDGDLRAKVLEGQRAYVAAADADAPALGIVEAQEQSPRPWTCRSRSPHESDALARRHAKLRRSWAAPRPPG